jgi:hypothetical protein
LVAEGVGRETTKPRITQLLSKSRDLTESCPAELSAASQSYGIFFGALPVQSHFEQCSYSHLVIIQYVADGVLYLFRGAFPFLPRRTIPPAQIGNPLIE